jgi:hypothetical protein
MVDDGGQDARYWLDCRRPSAARLESRGDDGNGHPPDDRLGRALADDPDTTTRLCAPGLSDGGNQPLDRYPRATSDRRAGGQHHRRRPGDRPPLRSSSSTATGPATAAAPTIRASGPRRWRVFVNTTVSPMTRPSSMSDAPRASCCTTSGASPAPPRHRNRHFAVRLREGATEVQPTCRSARHAGAPTPTGASTCRVDQHGHNLPRRMQAGAARDQRVSRSHAFIVVTPGGRTKSAGACRPGT